MWLALLVPACQSASPDAAPGPTTRPSPLGDTVAAPPEVVALVNRAGEAYNALATYRVVLHKQGREDWDHESIALRVRVEPRALGMQWQEGGLHAKREAIYLAGASVGRIHVRLADMPIPLKLSFAQDDPLLRRASPYRISDVGLGPLWHRLADALRRAEPGRFRYDGLTEGPDGRAAYRIVQERPGGGQAVWSIDAATDLLVGVDETQADGTRERSIHYTLIELNPDLTEAAFDPDTL